MTHRYLDYKPSGVQWLGDIPSHWEVKRLKYLSQIKKGKVPKNILHEYQEGFLPYLSMDYLRNGEPISWVSDNHALSVKDNEILLLWDGSNAGEFIRAKNGVVSSTMAHVNFYNINQSFAWYYTNVLEKELRNQIIGMGIPHVDGDILRNSAVALPPISEQTAIAHYLDRETAKIDALLQKQAELLVKLSEKRTALITHAVTKGLNPNVPMKNSGVAWLGDIPSHWEIYRLKDIVTCNDETLGDKTDLDYEMLYVDISSVSLNQGILKKEPMIFENSPSRARRIVKNGDVIISTVRTYLKAIAQIDKAENNLIVSTGFAVLRSKKDLLPKFLGYWVQSEFFIAKIVSNSIGVSYPAINATDLIRLPILKIPLSEQTAIANYLDRETAKIDALCDKIRELSDRLTEYRTTLISDAVTGKIKVIA